MTWVSVTTQIIWSLSRVILNSEASETVLICRADWEKSSWVIDSSVQLMNSMDLAAISSNFPNRDMIRRKCRKGRLRCNLGFCMAAGKGCCQITISVGRFGDGRSCYLSLISQYAPCPFFPDITSSKGICTWYTDIKIWMNALLQPSAIGEGHYFKSLFTADVLDLKHEERIQRSENLDGKNYYFHSF